MLATTLPLGLFAARLISTSWTQQQQLVDAQNIQQVRTLAEQVDEEVGRAFAALHVLAGLKEIQAPDLTLFTVHAQSPGKGRGSMFTLRLPLAGPGSGQGAADSRLEAPSVPVPDSTQPAAGA